MPTSLMYSQGLAGNAEQLALKYFTAFRSQEESDPSK